MPSSDDRLLVMLQATESEIQCEMAHIADFTKRVWEIIGLVFLFATSRFEVRWR